MRTLIHLAAGALTVAALAGCAGLNQVSSEVRSYSQWPAGRQPGSYVYERLPSQQVDASRQQRLEDAARGALAAAGFTEAGAGQTSDFSVQLGARVIGVDGGPGSDPFWPRGIYPWVGYGHRGQFYLGSGFGWGAQWTLYPGRTYYEREVALLVRDRRTGQPVYETRATHSSGSPGIDALLPALFDAALSDFPHADPNPRRVTTPSTP